MYVQYDYYILSYCFTIDLSSFYFSNEIITHFELYSYFVYWEFFISIILALKLESWLFWKIICFQCMWVWNCLFHLYVDVDVDVENFWNFHGWIFGVGRQQWLLLVCENHFPLKIIKWIDVFIVCCLWWKSTFICSSIGKIDRYENEIRVETNAFIPLIYSAHDMGKSQQTNKQFYLLLVTWIYSHVWNVICPN